MSVPQFTTPTLIFTFDDENLDLTQASQIIVSMESMGTRKQIEKSGSDLVVEAKKVTIELSQEETSALSIGDVKMMINWVFANGKRGASKKAIVNIEENLHRAVM